jgi:carboxy-cis,cis-muconate cyclase
VARNDEANGGHSWLCTDTTKNNLYATSWSTPPALAAYSICYDDNSTHPTLKLINTVAVEARPGYVCCSEKAIYAVGGPSGEVFSRDLQTGGFTSAQPIQKLSFVEETVDRKNVQLRHGAHSVDLSPDNKSIYVADM